MFNETCVSNALRVPRDGRRGGAKKFYITGDLNVELVRICTDENDIEELNEMYGALCRQRYDHDPGGYKKFMWYSIMKEFTCKVSSTWSDDDCSEDAAFTHRNMVMEDRGTCRRWIFFIWPNDGHDDCFIYNEGKLWDTWGEYPIYARIQEGRDAEQFLGKKNWCGWA